jgi:pyruvate/2-oxoglutarate dehydrogenase complex dihydrolipoamide dehydrogenase (E3) component
VPPIAGLDAVPFLTNESVWELDRLPENLIVIGGGPIGIEMAQAFRQLGSRVTVLEMARILPADDPDLADVVRRALAAAGTDIREGIEVTKVEAAGQGVRVTAGGASFDGSHVLLAAGRRPNIDGLGLEAAGIAHTPKGVTVDARLRTTNKRVFAVGDAAGAHQFTHVANYHAGIVIRNVLLRWPVKVDTRAIPWVTYTDPELAQVGFTETAARDRFDAVRVTTFPFAENDRAIAEAETAGFVKVVTGKRGRILGAGIVGPRAGELIQIWGLAIQNRLGIGKVAAAIAPYPTFGEANKRAAGSYFAPSVFGPRMHALVRFLRRFG